MMTDSSATADLDRAKTVLLADDSLGCAACRTDGETGRSTILTGTGRGVRPLLQWLAVGQRLDGFAAADRVVGKGAALLYARLGVRAVYAQTVSEAGLAALRANGIEAGYGTLVPRILDRAKTGLCPIEQSVVAINDPAAAEPAIRAAVAELMHR
ncbi:DUF1893 domain-containing protein [Bifidobacterium simiiventris]|uniref:DUF1893 domain-containing protein n=1 Tax=Bifidobacterium simiiventris TaxID=2834434 RepID=UPI001C596049|nr:DUF1893 domain-containing protein [Bifidobacterium simiiventris]MBW3079293.1 DUF1893 domain-containing protein [Bifidobacterium simiiventris]